jgi:hypothetical protein
MFTIRHVDGTVDNIYSADRVTFCDPSRHTTPGTATGDRKAPALLGALELRNFPDTFVAGLWGGMAYVMNETGATVARYDLPPDPRVLPARLDSRFDNVVD